MFRNVFKKSNLSLIVFIKFVFMKKRCVQKNASRDGKVRLIDGFVNIKSFELL